MEFQVLSRLMHKLLQYTCKPFTTQRVNNQHALSKFRLADEVPIDLMKKTNKELCKP
jgi:hypothetical protein